ncbi:uncharacterized protein [Halyomorpha halys]|uniref:uncharacterized protein n=1 Tax=Halyomorpha halys TaxID=286706 RepID=UPI0006D5206F|nr:protein lin-28 homolog [Halyomorpha halys]
MMESCGQAEGSQKKEFLKGVLKVQLNHYLGRPGSLPRDRDFIECAHDLVVARERREARFEKSQAEWTEVRSQRSSAKRTTHNSGGFEKMPSKGPEERRQRSDRRCYECNRTGHVVAQCKYTRCYECGRQEHIARECPRRNSRQNRREPPLEPMEVNNQDWNSRQTEKRSGRHSTSDESSGEESVRSERSRPASRSHEVRGGKNIRNRGVSGLRFLKLRTR